MARLAGLGQCGPPVGFALCGALAPGSPACSCIPGKRHPLYDWVLFGLGGILPSWRQRHWRCPISGWRCWCPCRISFPITTAIALLACAPATAARAGFAGLVFVAGGHTGDGRAQSGLAAHQYVDHPRHPDWLGTEMLLLSFAWRIVHPTGATKKEPRAKPRKPKNPWRRLAPVRAPVVGNLVIEAHPRTGRNQRPPASKRGAADRTGPARPADRPGQPPPAERMHYRRSIRLERPPAKAPCC